MKKQFLLFDLDGTISDPLIGIHRSINHALEYFGYPLIDNSRAGEFIGPPLDDTFSILAQTDDISHLSDLVKKFRERYVEVGYSENTLYPGIIEAIDTLTSRNVPLGICTSKRKDFAEKILKMFGLYESFLFVSGGDIGISKQQQIQSLLFQNLIDEQTLMIGDRYIDLLSAHKNGLKSAGVLWGYGSSQELEEHSPSCILKHPKELEELSL